MNNKVLTLTYGKNHQQKKEKTMKEYDDWLDLTHDEAYNDHFGHDEEEEIDNYYEDCKEPY